MRIVGFIGEERLLVFVNGGKSTITIKGVEHKFKWPDSFFLIERSGYKVFVIYNKKVYNSPFMNDSYGVVCGMPSLNPVDSWKTIADKIVSFYRKSSFTEYRAKVFDNDMQADVFWKMCVEKGEIIWSLMKSHQIASVNEFLRRFIF